MQLVENVNMRWGLQGLGKRHWNTYMYTIVITDIKQFNILLALYDFEKGIIFNILL